MSQNPEISGKTEFDSSVTSCGNCRTPMPVGLRFCRNCGFRLGEGPAEYTETVRFQDGKAGATQQPFAPNYAAPLAASPTRAFGKPRKRMSGMSWMFIGLLVFFLAAAAFTAIVAPIGRDVPSISIPEKPLAYFGVMSLRPERVASHSTTWNRRGRRLIKPVSWVATSSPAVDGHPVTTEDEITELRGRIEIGKPVDVIYLRDGEQKTTKLTPILPNEFERLEEEFANRPGGKGRLGFDDDDTARVPIPGTKMFGSG